jgi:uncharacterized protein YbjT (DUF2867 family)
MARFDLSKYATVAERLAMLEAAYPDYRLETVDYSTEQDRAKGIWRVRAVLYLSADDQAKGLHKATGHAFEVDSGQGPQSTSALEVCETSAVGRCLALASSQWSGNKDDASKSLASREEMEKAARGKPAKPTVEAPAGFFDQVKETETLDTLQGLWETAKQAGYADFVRDAITKRKKELEGAKNA